MQRPTPAGAARPPIALIAPEPAAWLAPLRARLGPVPLVELALPGGRALKLALRLWSRGRTDRQMAARFALRRATDLYAARWLAAAGPLSAVIAQSGAARATFAAARARGLPTTLVQDVPLMRQMHADLDRAALQHPECRFLRRYRASHALLVRQETEWALADRILVRGAFAAERLAARSRAVIEVLPAPLVPAARRAARGRVVLLAGLATARSGVLEALAALAGMPATLLCRPGEGLEPADLLQRPGVRAVTLAQRQRLEGVDLVLAPALCESYPEEVTLALARGVPVIASRCAAGPFAPEAFAALVAPGDVAGLRAALYALP